MIAIVDNGKGAADIARIVRGSIVMPSEAAKTKVSAFILSDGADKHSKENIDLVKKVSVPVLALGSAYGFMLAAFGAKPIKADFDKNEMLHLERPCSLLLDMKRMFAVKNSCAVGVEDVPESFDVFATSKAYPFEILGHVEKPFFALHFNPEQGLDGTKILQNFAKFAEVWEKYHRGR